MAGGGIIPRERRYRNRKSPNVTASMFHDDYHWSKVADLLN